MDGGGSSFANPQKPEEDRESPHLTDITAKVDDLRINNSHESSFPFPAEFNNIATLFDFHEAKASKFRSWRFLRKQRLKQIKLDRFHANQEYLKQRILQDIPHRAALLCILWENVIDGGITPIDAKTEAMLQSLRITGITEKSMAEALVKAAEEEYGITLECDYDTKVFPKFPLW